MKARQIFESTQVGSKNLCIDHFAHLHTQNGHNIVCSTILVCPLRKPILLIIQKKITTFLKFVHFACTSFSFITSCKCWRQFFFFSLTSCTHRSLINLGHNMLLLVVLLDFRIFCHLYGSSLFTITSYKLVFF